MRNPSKVMIGLLAGVTLLTPIAAQAQEQDRGDRRGGAGRAADEHGGGGWQRGGPDRGDAGARVPEPRQPVEARPAPEPRATAPVPAAAPAARDWNRADDSRRAAPPQRDPSVGVARGVYDRRQPDRPAVDPRRGDDRNA